MRSLPISAVTLLVAAVALPSVSYASTFSAKFSWQGIPPCSTTSPAFTVSGVPRGTVALAFLMRDQDAPDFQHGGSTVPYAGVGKVSKVSITYVGPCPPPAHPIATSGRSMRSAATGRHWVRPRPRAGFLDDDGILTSPESR